MLVSSVAAVSNSLLVCRIFEVCGTVPAVVVGEISAAMISRFRGVARGKGALRTSDNTAMAATTLLNILGGYVPQGAQARYLRDLIGIDPATGALVIPAVHALGGSALESAIPAVLCEVIQPFVPLYPTVAS
jgi:hypothetical protein